MTDRDRTLREALAVALEGLPTGSDMMDDTNARRAIGSYLRSWIKSYALRRGVILEDADLDDEIRSIIAELRRKS